MYRISQFREILKPLPRSVFERIVDRHQSDKYGKGFGSWKHLVVMRYAQLSGASSLRVLEAGFNSQSHHHYHLGAGAVRRSTLSEANGRRSPEVFAEAARLLMNQVKRHARKEVKEWLYLLDSTSFTLKGACQKF